MTDKTKKIIAREGLVVLGCIIIGIVAYCLLPLLPKYLEPVPSYKGISLFFRISMYKEFIGVGIYLLYWVMRFTIWAVSLKKAGNIRLYITERWEKFWLGKISKWVMFKLGFSQCRYCVYCNSDGTNYRDVAQSILLVSGKCHWAKGLSGGHLNYDEIRQYHRCDGFMLILYNFKGYAIDREEVEKIISTRADTAWKWLGWIVAALALVLTYLNYKAKI